MPKTIHFAKLMIVILVTVKEISNSTTTYYGSISSSQNCSTSSYDIGHSNLNTLSVLFMLNSNFACSSALMMTSFTPILCSNFTLESIQQNQNNNLYMDTESANGCDWQLVNIPIPNNTYMVYITIFNFNIQPLSSPVGYALEVITLSNGKICMVCPPGASLEYSSSNPLLCQCQPCPTNYVGSNCQYFLQQLVSSQQLQKNLTGSVAYYFRISTSAATIIVSFGQTYYTNSAYLHMQYESEYGQIAGPFDNYYMSSGNPFRQLITINKSSITISTKGMNVLLTIIHPGSGNATAFIQYTVNQQISNVAAIIGGVVGGVCGLIVIIIVICFIKKRCSLSRPVSIKNSNIQIQQSILYEENLNLYFPAVLASSVFRLSPLQSNNESMSDLNEKQSQAPTKNQCIICLNAIEDDELIRVTYCRHIFHAVCLVNWFKKTENCPYCRKEFNLKATHQMFLYFQNKKRILKGINLVLAILGDKIKKLKKLPSEKQTDPRYEEIQIQSK